ncbi:hypothetical protein [Cellulomonas massiliensis]|uniref:hypothetical protein n=1 Tax=Cellulomonas massiliensis TaxID=1465811 RepID=UPI0002E056E1|nr:hypothetical protein [Cellulomonas massiliensis]
MGDDEQQTGQPREGEDATTAIGREQEITQGGSGSAPGSGVGSMAEAGTGPDESELDPEQADEDGRADAG